MSQVQEPELQRRAAARGSGSRSDWIRRITTPLAILLVAGAILFWARQREHQHLHDVEQAARDLTREVLSDPDREALGPVARRLQASHTLISRLGQALADAEGKIDYVRFEVESGDVGAPIGDGSATQHVRIMIDDRPRIGLRFHHPGEAADIVLMGFWMDDDRTS